MTNDEIDLFIINQEAMATGESNELRTAIHTEACMLLLAEIAKRLPQAYGPAIPGIAY